MKNLLVLLFILPFTSVYSQTSFYDGFNAGYQAGYCYGEYGCIAPPGIASGPSIAPIGQSEYQHGYNTGFTEGQKDKSSPKKQNKRVAPVIEPDRTQEYIQDGVRRLMEEQAARAKKKLEEADK